MKSCLENIDREIYSTHNKGKSVVVERFIRTVKNNIYRYMKYMTFNNKKCIY